tara:strand:- start:119 stop:268 length:150 start_codon:yes stop_codon:yes gene_type:complete
MSTIPIEGNAIALQHSDTGLDGIAFESLLRRGDVLFCRALRPEVNGETQ